MALILSKTTTDKCIILSTRQALIYPFVAPGWTDLRLGMFLSVTQLGADDGTSGLAETIITTGIPSDRAWFGFKENNDIQPQQAGTHFIGLGSVDGFPDNATNELLASALFSGAPGTDIWAVTSRNCVAQQWDGTTWVGATGVSNIIQIKLPQNTINAGGYAGLFMMRLTRASGSTTITNAVYGIVAGAAHSSIILFSNDPNIGAIRAQLANIGAYSPFGQSNNIGTVPDAIYAYWPFHNSRLRIHAIVLEKFA